MIINTYKIEIYEESIQNKTITTSLEKILIENGWVKNELSPNYVFVLGGDGTFLRSFSIHKDKKTRIIGINSGTLGFYTVGSWETLSKKKDFIKYITNDEKFHHPLVLQSTLYNEKEEIILNLTALNDLVIQNPLTLKGCLYINKKNKFLDYVGTGLIFCTPTGSTGSNKSNNGPLFFSTLNAYCLSFIMPINNNKYVNFTNPLLFHKNEQIMWEVKNTDFTWELINDGNLYGKELLINVKKINIRLVNAKCEIYMSSDTTDALVRLKNFF